MPSLRSLFLGLSLAVLLQLSSAVPTPARIQDRTCSADSTSTPSLPVNGGGSELPGPGNLTLKYIALGRGIQNYTCATADSAPVALGAVATLYDGTLVASTDPSMFDTLPPAAVYMPLPATGDFTINSTSLPVLGHHYFDITGTPTFNLSTVGDLLVGKKTADIKAPSTANVGPADTGAVDWLQLQDKGGSIGVSEVYRVVTAGGNPETTCSTAGVMTIQYAAEYWFYD